MGDLYDPFMASYSNRDWSLLIFTFRSQYDENCVVSIASKLMQLRSLNFGLRHDDDCAVGFASTWRGNKRQFLPQYVVLIYFWHIIGRY